MSRQLIRFRAVFLLGALAISACAPAPSPIGTTPLPIGASLGTAHPGASAALTPREAQWVEQTLSSLTLRQKIGQLIMPWVGGEYAAVGSPEFEQVRKWVEDDGVGGLVLSIGEPLAYAAKLNELQSRARVPLLVASDMENGPGMRLSGIYALPSLLPQGGGTAFPPVMALGATRSEELAFELGQVLGREARAIGVHLVFGPVLDVNANPLNPIINTRSFGEDPALVSSLATAYIRGARSTGLMTTGKHFPGHGDTDVDSHLDLPTIYAGRAHLDSVDFPPFRAAISADIDAIMTAHIAEIGVEGRDAPPATLSRLFMSDVLRNEMGFHGLLFTDAMTMGGIAKRYGATEPLILALEAGTDFLLMPRDVTTAVETVLEAVRSGRLSEARIDASVRRVLIAKARAGLIAGRLVNLSAIDRIVDIPANEKVAEDVAERSITLGRDLQNLVPISGAGTRRILSITYAGASDLIAGSAFDAAMRSRSPHLQTARTDARTSAAEYAALRSRADSADVVIVSAYVSPTAFKGTIAADTSLAGMVDSLARAKKPVVLISFGSPYLVSAFPDVSSYVFAWGGAPICQRAAARALFGERAITGKLPISIPPLLKFGDGIPRAAIPSVSRDSTSGSDR
jgi:beta-N-acetylhexosaminidase